MGTSFAAKLETVWGAYLTFQQESLYWLAMLRGGQIEQIREQYYNMNERKKELDGLLLALKQDFDPQKAKTDWTEQEKGAWIHTLYFTAQSMELRTMELYSNYLKQHQKELFWPEAPDQAKPVDNLIARSS